MLLTELLDILLEERLALGIQEHNHLINPHAIIIDCKINEEEELEHLNLSKKIKKRVQDSQYE